MNGGWLLAIREYCQSSRSWSFLAQALEHNHQFRLIPPASINAERALILCAAIFIMYYAQTF